MLEKLTYHISMLAIHMLQFLSHLFSFHFSSSAFPNLNFRKKKNLSLRDCKSMAKSPWASARPTPPPPVMPPSLVFFSFKVFLQLSLSSHCTHTTAVGGAHYLCHHHWWLPGLPSLLLKFIFSFIFFYFFFSFNYFDDQSCMILFGFEKWGFWVLLNVL